MLLLQILLHTDPVISLTALSRCLPISCKGIQRLGQLSMYIWKYNNTVVKNSRASKQVIQILVFFSWSFIFTLNSYSILYFTDQFLNSYTITF